MSVEPKIDRDHTAADLRHLISHAGEGTANGSLCSGALARIEALESALSRFADGDLWGHDGYWHQWHGSDDPKEFARETLRKSREQR